MTLRHHIGDAAHALKENIYVRRGEGYAVVDGCGVTVAASGSSIDIDVGDGTVRHDGALISVSAQTITLPDGGPQNPRQDLIYIDRDGTAQYLQGTEANYVPTGRRGNQTWSPPPPAAPNLDGVVLATVLVPAEATDTDDLPTDQLDQTVVRDWRVADISGIGVIPERSSDPDAADLGKTQVWLNTSANSGDGEFRAYNAASEKIEALSTTPVSSVTPGSETVIESFDSDISANWNFYNTKNFTYGSPNIEGSAAMQFDGTGPHTFYSLPGDGLNEYPESGQTASFAVYYKSGANEVGLGIGKENSHIHGVYFARLILSQDIIQVFKWNSNGNVTELGSTSASFSSGNWYIADIEYDGGGTGVHPVTVYNESGGGRGSQLATIGSPTADTEFRGRGVEITANQDWAIDRYTIQDT